MTIRTIATPFSVALGLVLVVAPSTAQATNKPISSINIVVKKDPGGAVWFRLDCGSNAARTAAANGILSLER